MIVYAESNFTLELAVLRSQSDSCEALIELAEAGDIQLVIPAFCGSEPYESMVRRSRHRQIIHGELEKEINELSRSSPYRNIAETALELTTMLSQSSIEEMHRLDDTILRLSKTARMIPLTSDVLAVSLTYQTQFSQTPQDAIVLASILADLESAEQEGKKLFVTQNKDDFLDPEMVELMSGYGCKLLFRFDNAVGYVESILKREK